MRKLCTIIPTILLSCLVTTGCLAEPQTVFEFSGAIDVKKKVLKTLREPRERSVVCDFKIEKPCVLKLSNYRLHITYDATQEHFAISLEVFGQFPYDSPIPVEDMKKGISISPPEWTKACECQVFQTIEKLTLNLTATEIKS